MQYKQKTKRGEFSSDETDEDQARVEIVKDDDFFIHDVEHFDEAPDNLRTVGRSCSFMEDHDQYANL
jgi:hypothetical protein